MSKHVFPILVAMLLTVGVGTADAAPIYYQATLTGANEFPPTGSPATGFATVVIDPEATDHSMTVSATFVGLTGTTTASHIHCCTLIPFVANAGVATTTPSFAGFPLGVTSGTFFNTLDLTQASSWNPAFIFLTGGTPGTAEAALESGLASGRAYFNIHTTAFGGGEIRGFLTPAAVPEPTSMVLLGTGLLGLVTRYRGRRR